MYPHTDAASCPAPMPRPQPLLHRDGCEHCTLGMVLLRHRRAKQRQKVLVPHVLQGTLILLDHLQGQGEHRLPRLVAYLGRLALRHRGSRNERPDQDRHHFVLPSRGLLEGLA